MGPFSFHGTACGGVGPEGCVLNLHVQVVHAEGIHDGLDLLLAVPGVITAGLGLDSGELGQDGGW